jgi:hypothetical protein
MMILHGFDVHSRLGPLWRRRAWLLERMAALDLVSGDLRWALIDLGMHGLSSLSGHGREWIAGIARNAGRRASRSGFPAADTPLLTPRWQQRVANLDNSSDTENAA